MDEIKAKQQVVEKIKGSSKILITVSNSPSVDALSAALGLALLLDKQEKYATAIVSGETPPAIAFLEPEKTFDDTTDSLRDFIIALNKEKADHLRYKVVEDAVKIFITPYKTTITEDDLEFSQGDYNVELVIALGVNNQDHLDAALENHGQILHDASIITVTAGDQTSDLGGVDWHDANASSLSEMVAGLAEALKDDKKKSLLDAPIATALLTGIVAQTDRFSNEHTTSKSMTIAATLMSAGADQQLIASELQAARTIEVKTPEDGALVDDAATEAEASEPDAEVEVDKDSNDGSMSIKKDRKKDDSQNLTIAHDGESLADLDRRIRGEKKAKQKVTEEVSLVQEKAAKAEAEEAIASKAAPGVNGEAVMDVQPASSKIEPVLGGTLNATAEQAADDARREAENDQNKTILSHSYLGSDASEAATPGSAAVNDVDAAAEAVHSAYALVDDAPAAAPVEAPVAPAAGFSGERVIQPLSSSEAPAAPPPAPTPADLGLPLPPPLPDFSQLGAVGGAPAPAIPLPQTQPPEILGDILAPESASADTRNAVAAPNTAYALETPVEAPVAPAVDPSVPPLPPLGSAPPVGQPGIPVPPSQPAPQQPASNDPGQFQIPPAQ